MTVDYQKLAAEQIWEVRRKLNVLGFPTAIENAIYELAVAERATTLEQAARIETLEKALGEIIQCPAEPCPVCGAIAKRALGRQVTFSVPTPAE